MSKSIQNYMVRRVLWRRLQATTDRLNPDFYKPLSDVFKPKTSTVITDVPRPVNPHFLGPIREVGLLNNQ